MAYSPIQLQALQLISKFYTPGEPRTIIPYSEAYSLFQHRAEDVFKSLEVEGLILYISGSFDSYQLQVYTSTFDQIKQDSESTTPSSTTTTINLNITINQYISQISQNTQQDQDVIELLQEIRDYVGDSIAQKKKLDDSWISKIHNAISTYPLLANVISKVTIDVPLKYFLGI